MVQVDDLIEHKQTGCRGVVLRWPRDRQDWQPADDGDEWVVIWLTAQGAVEDLACAGDFTVVGRWPTAEPRVTKVYFGSTIEVFHNGVKWHPFPWRFRITTPEGRVLHYAGIPNQCETKRSAFRRGWWRAKWLADGTYYQRYRPPGRAV